MFIRSSVRSAVQNDAMRCRVVQKPPIYPAHLSGDFVGHPGESAKTPEVRNGELQPLQFRPGCSEAGLAVHMKEKQGPGGGKHPFALSPKAETVPDTFSDPANLAPYDTTDILMLSTGRMGNKASSNSSRARPGRGEIR